MGDDADIQRAVELDTRYADLSLGLVDAAAAERVSARAIATLDLRDFSSVELVGAPGALVARPVRAGHLWRADGHDDIIEYDYHASGRMRFRASVTEVLRNFSDYINRVSYRGERFVLTRGGKDVAELTPAPPTGRRLAELPDVLESLPHLGSDEAARLAEDLASGRAASGGGPPPDPWAS